MPFSDVVKTCYQTSEVEPFVMEGELSDGRFFHFKYRFEWATLKVADSWPGLVMANGVTLSPGFELGGWMTRPQFEVLFADMLRLHDFK